MNETNYPIPFYLRFLNASSKLDGIVAITLFMFLLVVGGVLNTIFSVQSYFQDSSYVLLFTYCSVISFGYWSLANVYRRTKQTLIKANMVDKIYPTLNVIYADRLASIWSVMFAVLVGVIQFALRFQIPPKITLYFFVWNFLGGFVAGLGLWMAFGSLQLATTIGKVKFEVYTISPKHSPILRDLSRLMWTYSFLFTSETLIFSFAVSWASIALHDKVMSLYGTFSALDLAGSLSFFLILIFCPLYTYVIQNRIQEAARNEAIDALGKIDRTVKKVISGENPKDNLKDLLATSDVIHSSINSSIDIPNLSKLLSIIVPGLTYLYSQNSKIINHIFEIVKKIFFPGI